MERLRVLASMGAAAVLIAGLGACGGGSSSPTVAAPAPTPTPCTQTTLIQDGGGIDPKMIVYDDFSVPDSGRLDMTLDWTFSDSPMGLYLVPANTCTTIDQFNARSCNFIVRSEPGGAKPRKVSAPNLAAGNYRWLIGNFADVAESVAFNVVLSKGSCPALAGGAPSASARNEAAPLTAERVASW
jgi:hypothetical protein